MRSSPRLLEVLALTVLIAASSVPAAAAQTDEPSADDLANLEKLGKLTLTVDPGGHIGEIIKPIFTRDGKHLITGGKDQGICIWDVATGERRRVIRVPGRGSLESHMYRLALSPDGATLAVAADYPAHGAKPSVIYLFSLEDGRITRMLKPPSDRIWALAYSPDGTRLASGEDTGVRLWSLADGKSVKIYKSTKPVVGLAFSLDGRKLAHAVADDETCRIQDINTRAQLGQLKGGRFSERWSSRDQLAWSADGKTLATCGEKGLWLWEADGKQRHHLLPTVKLATVSLSPDSQRALVTWKVADHRVAIIDVQTGKQLLMFTPPRPYADATLVRHAVFSPTGQLAASVGGGRGEREIFLWKTSDGMLVRRIGLAAWLSGSDVQAGWSLDGQSVSWRTPASSTASFDFANLQFGPPLKAPNLQGLVLKTGPLALKRLDASTIQVQKDGKGLSDLRHSDRITLSDIMTFVGPERVIVHHIHLLHVFAARTGKHVGILRPGGYVGSAAASPNGRYLLTLSHNQVLHVWDVGQSLPLLSLYVSGNDWIAWTKEGYYAGTPGGERLIGWTVDNGIDRDTTYFPAERFRKHLYRPDVIKLVLAKGNLQDALAAANAAMKKEGRTVSEGVASLETLLPPQVSLRIVDAKNLPKVTVLATGVAATKAQPITALRLLIDGRPAAEADGAVVFPKGVLKAEQTWTITLPGEKAVGAYRLSVLARSHDTSNLSNSVEVSYVNAAKLPTLHVFNVGINDYQDPSLRLQFAAPDARALAGAFAQSGSKGGLFTRVNSNVLVDKDATRDRILQALAEMRKNVKSNDLVVVSFACHGVKEKERFYLLTVETDAGQLSKTALSGEVLRKALADFPCQVLLLLDACHSAGFGEGRKLSKLGLRPATDDATRALTDDETGVAVMCAAMGHEKAEEKDGNGFFTKAIVQALNHAQGVPFNRRDHRMYIHHLHTFVFDEVKDRSNDRQHPFLSLPWIVESFPVVQFAGSSR